MNIRNIATIVVITCMLGSSGVWGARLIKSQPQAGTEQTQKADNTIGKKTQMQNKSIQPSASYSGRPPASPPSPTPPSRTMTPYHPSQTARTDRENVSQPPVSPGSRSGKGDASKDEISKDGKQYVTMDFDGVDIKVFVKFIADITGKNFILDDKVAGKITVISPRKMSLDEAYQVFLSVLDVNGFGTVNMGGVIKVVQAADAITRSIGTSMDPPKRREDVLITQIIPMKHVDCNDMKTLFTPLLTRGSSQLLAYPQSNILIITDTKSNIKKMMEILKFIDVSGFSEEFRIFPLTHASAADLGAKLQDILSDDSSNRSQRVRAPGQRGNLSERGKAKIIPYERTNSLIILASATDIAGVESLISKLDIPTPTGKEDIHVYYLQYANAEALAKVLTDMPTPAKAEGTASPSITPDGVQRGMRSVTNSEKVKISSDKETNSLIIYADPDDYQSMVETIKYLDIPRKQVFVKAMIMEVNQDKDFKVGVEWTLFEDFSYDSKTGSDGTRQRRTGGVFGRTGEKFVTSPADVPSGAILGIVGEAITIGSGSSQITFPNITSFINAMAHDTDVNIISTPQIITMDNKEAEIRVGANVPYLTREDTDSTNIDRTVRTFDYRDVGVTLRMTPQINQQGNIRLELFQENTSLVTGQGEQQFAPTTLKRSAKTTVTVKDGSTMVIGGLIGQTLTLGETRVPLLSRIPILGYLFKSMLNKHEKTNLYIFLTPRIIDTEEKVTGLYKEKYGEMGGKGGKLIEKEKGKADENPKP